MPSVVGAEEVGFTPSPVRIGFAMTIGGRNGDDSGTCLEHSSRLRMAA